MKKYEKIKTISNIYVWRFMLDFGDEKSIERLFWDRRR